MDVARPCLQACKEWAGSTNWFAPPNALMSPQAASENDVPALPNGQPSSTAVQAAAPLAARCGMEDTNGPACPLTGLTLSQIAELKRSPPEALQREWKSIAQRLT